MTFTNTALAHPHATGVALYPALFLYSPLFSFSVYMLSTLWLLSLITPLWGCKYVGGLCLLILVFLPLPVGLALLNVRLSVSVRLSVCQSVSLFLSVCLSLSLLMGCGKDDDVAITK